LLKVVTCANKFGTDFNLTHWRDFRFESKRFGTNWQSFLMDELFKKLQDDNQHGGSDCLSQFIQHW
jgi:hypothetical protein